MDSIQCTESDPSCPIINFIHLCAEKYRNDENRMQRFISVTLKQENNQGTNVWFKYLQCFKLIYIIYLWQALPEMRRYSEK